MLKFLKNPFVVLGAVLLLLANSSSHPTNNGGYTGAPGDGVCSQCHSGGSFTGEINIDGVPATITAGNTYQITVTVTNPNLNINEAGFQIVALTSSNTNAGNFTSPSAGSSVKTSATKKYWGHAPSIPFSGLGELTWTATWTAPATGSGDITFYGGAVLANGNNSSSLDKFVQTQTSGTLASSPTPLSVTLTNVENVSCNGGSDGSATAVPAGGTPNYSYAWNNGETTATASALPAGTARVTVTDNSGNTSTASINITQPTAINLSVTNTNSPSCFNSANGSVTVNATGGAGGFFYDWSNGASGATITGLDPGTYFVTATDNNNCEKILQVNLSGPPAIQVVSAFVSNVTCFGGNNGAIDLTATGGTGALDIEWSSGQTGGSITNLAAGSYTASITDNQGCQLETSYNVSQPQAVGGNVVVTTPISCQGGSNGVATATGSGGTGPYTFIWSTGATSAQATNLSAGTYVVTITDKNNCSGTKQVVLSDPAGMSINTTNVVNASCPGVANGSATISVSGGNNPYTVLWSTGATGLTLSNVTSGTYQCTVTDNKLCTKVSSVTIGSDQQATLELLSTVSPTCFGLSNGSINILASNANGYTINWSTGQSGSAISQLPAGIYTAVANNSAGCISNMLTVELTQPAAISQDTTTVQDISCAGLEDGSIEVLYAGGTGALQYTWSNDSTGSYIDSLTQGTYFLTITDVNGCNQLDSFVIVNPDSLAVDSFILTTPTCYNSMNGGLIVLASGGTGALSFAWSNGLVGDTLTNLAAGQYIYHLSDVNNCLVSDTVLLAGPTAFEPNDTITNTSVQGSTDGKIQTSFEGGSQPYLYNWSTGDTTSFIDSLAEGLYLLTITDAAGCTEEFQFNVQSGNCALSVAYAIQNVSCFGDSTGVISFAISNGIPPFTINENSEGLPAGSYNFIIEDSVGCTFVINNIVITEPSLLTAEVDSITNTTGPTKADGSVDISVEGGTAGYQYIWLNAAGDTVSTQQDLSNALPGLYSVVVLDLNECSYSIDSISIGFVSSIQEGDAIKWVSVSPNPFNTQLEVQNLAGEGTISIFDLSGKRISVTQFQGSERKSFDTASWPSGWYLVKVQSKGSEFRTFRLIK